MVYFKTAAFGLISALLAGFGQVQAFTPSASSSNPAAKKVELARAKVENMFGNTNEYKSMVENSMKMVSGGAQAEEYYEGEYSLACLLSYLELELHVRVTSYDLYLSLLDRDITLNDYTS